MTTTMTTETTYTKLRSGEWGIRSTRELNPGAYAQVAKRSGEVKAELVGNLVWGGGGVSCEHDA